MMKWLPTYLIRIRIRRSVCDEHLVSHNLLTFRLYIFYLVWNIPIIPNWKKIFHFPNICLIGTNFITRTRIYKIRVKWKRCVSMMIYHYYWSIFVFHVLYSIHNNCFKCVLSLNGEQCYWKGVWQRQWKHFTSNTIINICVIVSLFIK